MGLGPFVIHDKARRLHKCWVGKLSVEKKPDKIILKVVVSPGYKRKFSSIVVKSSLICVHI